MQRARLAAFTEDYRKVQAVKHDAEKNVGTERLTELSACAKDCTELCEQASAAGEEDPQVMDINHLAAAKRAECLISYARLHGRVIFFQCKMACRHTLYSHCCIAACRSTLLKSLLHRAACGIRRFPLGAAA